MTPTNVLSSTAAAGGGKPHQTIALAFAVASLQNPGLVEGLHSLPQALLDAAVASSNQTYEAQPPLQLQSPSTSPHVSANNNNNKVMTSSKRQKLKHSHVDGESGEDEMEEEEEEEEEEGNHQEHHRQERDREEDEDDSERRLARSRERNREHARRTRLRKKAQLEALQAKVKGLEAERQVLEQKVEECGIASILLGLSSGTSISAMEDAENGGGGEAVVSTKKKNHTERRSDMVAVLSGTKRKRFISEAIGEQSQLQQQQQQHRLTINIDGKVTEIGAGKSHINWKTGLYRDNEGVQKQLTTEQLEVLRYVYRPRNYCSFLGCWAISHILSLWYSLVDRRERNRIHAKMTRSRKKCFIATIEKAIAELEAENHRMKEILDKTSGPSLLDMSSWTLHQATKQTLVTPATSPSLPPRVGPAIFLEDETRQAQAVSSQPPKSKASKHESGHPAASHGFCLDD